MIPGEWPIVDTPKDHAMLDVLPFQASENNRKRRGEGSQEEPSIPSETHISFLSPPLSGASPGIILEYNIITAPNHFLLSSFSSAKNLLPNCQALEHLL